MKETLRGIVSGCLATAGCFGAYVPFQLSLGASLGFGLAVFVGTYFAIPRKKGSDEVVIDTNAGLTEADREDVVAKIDAYRSEMLASKLAFERLNHPKTAEKIDRVIKLVDAIADRTKRKPAEIPRVESFADYHLARVSKLVSEYADIADGLQTDRIRTEIEKLKGILDVVADGFEDFYEKLKLRRMDDLRIDGEAYMAVLNFEKE